MRHMNLPLIVMLVAVVISLLGWACRYEMARVGKTNAYYLLNRWTGEVYLLTPADVRRIPEAP